MMMTGLTTYLDLQTRFLYSTSGSAASIVKHNKALQDLGLNVTYFTIARSVNAEVYTGLLRAPFALGGAVTAHGGLKSTVIPFLDHVDKLAAKTQAVNTIINKNGELWGFNTDAFGLKEALEHRIRASASRIRTAVIYGNGGVSGVAWHILKDLGLEVAMRGRDMSRVIDKKKALGIAGEPEPGEPFDLVVDATPVSSSPGFLEAPGFRTLLEGAKMVFCHNMPEKDGRENYLEDYCRNRRLEFIPGAAMYRGQLIKQYELFLEGILKPDGTPVTEYDIVSAWNL